MVGIINPRCIPECSRKLRKKRLIRTVNTKKVQLGTLLIALIIALALIAFWRNEIFDFIYRHFIQTLGWGYNPVNTIVYGIVLVFSVFMVSRLLVRLKVELDERFILSVSPYIFIGSAGRALEDLGFFQSVLFVSPLIFFLVFAYTLLCLLISLLAGKKTGKPFHVFFLVLGLIPSSYLVYNVAINIVEPQGTALILLYATIATLIALPLMHLVDRLINVDGSLLNYSIVAAHLLDASATHVSVTFFPYSEQHVLTSFVASFFGTTAILFPLKFLIVFAVLVLLDRYIPGEEKALKGLTKLALLILGLAPGLRDLFRLAMFT